MPSTSPATMPAVAEARRLGGTRYLVSKFEIGYRDKAIEGLPLPQELMQLEVRFGHVGDGFVAPAAGVPDVRFRLADAREQTVHHYYQSAIAHINSELLRYFNQEKKIVGVYVEVDKNDIVPKWDQDERERLRDLRGEDKTLHLVVYVGRVTEMRTVASGDRIPEEQRINNAMHRRILNNSPIQPGTAGQEIANDILRKNFLDEYAFRLNRRPSRHVEAAISAAQQEGGVALDYLVLEAKPWSIYGQVSNTGTEQTSEWRERFGLAVNDLSDAEDNLSIDFTTAGFDSSNALIGSYEAMFLGIERLRWKAYGSWSEFVASDVGLSGEVFTGEESGAGAELIANIFQRRELFIDLVGGLQYKNISVDNPAAQTQGEGEFVLPYVGLRLERNTERTSTEGGVNMIFGRGTAVDTVENTGSVRTVREGSADGLGRLEADTDWWALQGNLGTSFFLEPVLSRNYTTLANEMVLSGRFQYTRDRLIPQEEMVAGGLYTVRGYPESASAGDKVFIGSIEYRYHIPRGFKVVNQQPRRYPLLGEIRWAPPVERGRPDWDLIFRTFLDVGRTAQSQRQANESDDWLVGSGIGVELQIKRNISVRVDWGIALRDLEIPDPVEAGDSRVHVAFMIIY